MSENSDAVVLVVSEETGTISIVHDGKITRNYNSVSAYAELSKYLLNDEIDKKDNAIITALKGFKVFGYFFKKDNGERQVEKDED